MTRLAEADLPPAAPTSPLGSPGVREGLNPAACAVCPGVRHPPGGPSMSPRCVEAADGGCGGQWGVGGGRGWVCVSAFS